MLINKHNFQSGEYFLSAFVYMHLKYKYNQTNTCSRKPFLFFGEKGAFCYYTFYASFYGKSSFFFYYNVCKTWASELKQGSEYTPSNHFKTHLFPRKMNWWQMYEKGDQNSKCKSIFKVSNPVQAATLILQNPFPPLSR